jgi:hypothetical protein
MSKLPGNIVAEKKKATHKATQVQQTIDTYMTERKLSEHIIPYSHQLFRKVAIE